MLSLLYRLADRCRHHARKRTWPAEQAGGRLGEDLAHRFLQKQSYIVVGRNYRTRSGSGEVDLIAWDGDTLVFVEVKARRTDEFGSPDRAIDADKRANLLRAAREYVHRVEADWQRTRFDVISVLFTQPPSIRHDKDVFRVHAAV